MKINSKDFRKKCLSEKYYSSIKYMSHALHGSQRREFICGICNINIYLGCQCAITCEQDESVDKHITKILNNFFKPRKAYYYDKSDQQKKISTRRLRSFDIANYLLACLLMGYKKSIDWYIYNHPVEKTILIRLASEMNEDQLLDLLVVLSRSDMNRDKMRGIGSAKNLYNIRNDYRVKKILKVMWDHDKDAYIQFAYDTGVLEEIWKTNKTGKSIYIHILNKCIKQKLALSYIKDILGEDKLISLLEKSVVGKVFIYLIYLEKLENGHCLTEEEYYSVKCLPNPPRKICNYYIPLFLRLKKANEFMPNIDYSKFYDSFGKLYVPLEKATASIGKASEKNLRNIVRSIPYNKWKNVIELFFCTGLSETNSLDTLFRQLHTYHKISKEDLIQEAQRYTLEIEPVDGGLKFLNVKTEKPILLTNTESDIQKDTVVSISDYSWSDSRVCVTIKP